MSYTLRIENQSGATQTVALFQADDPPSGSPLVWLSQIIPSGNTQSFSWEINWSLGFGSTTMPLATGVVYTSQSESLVDPKQANGNNKILISYADSSFTIEATYYNSQLDTGVMQITTDKSFTVSGSLDMAVAVYMNNTAILASQLKPNTSYQFTSNVVYYLTVTGYQVGTVLPSDVQPQIMSFAVVSSANNVSTPTPVSFTPGVTSLTYILNDVLEFVQQS